MINFPNPVVQLVSIFICLTLSFAARSEEGIEVRAARVCGAVAKSGWDAKGPLDVDNLTVRGSDLAGHIVVSKDGVDLGTFEKGTYKDYEHCLVSIISILKGETSNTAKKIVVITNHCRSDDAKIVYERADGNLSEPVDFDAHKSVVLVKDRNGSPAYSKSELVYVLMYNYCDASWVIRGSDGNSVDKTFSISNPEIFCPTGGQRTPDGPERFKHFAMYSRLANGEKIWALDLACP